MLVPGNPVKLSKVAEGPETRVPWVGEHTDAVLRAELGLDDDRARASCATDGVIDLSDLRRPRNVGHSDRASPNLTTRQIGRPVRSAGAAHGLRVLPRAAGVRRAEVEAFLDEHDDPDVFDLTRENMAQIVDTPKRRAFMAELGAQGLARA